MKDNLHPDGLSTKASIQSVIERKFEALRGINCRFRLGTAVPASLEIDRIIVDRLTGARDLYSRRQGAHVKFIKKCIGESDLSVDGSMGGCGYEHTF